MNIPFNKVYLTGREQYHINRAIEMGSMSGDGYYNQKVVDLLEKELNSKVLTTTSGTHSLELAMLLVGIKPGDEVIMPSYTFSSTANAVMLYGGIPVFADICEDSLSINVEEIKKRITPKTKAIIPVHYGGIGCEMDHIVDLAKKYHLYVIEDAAQALGASYKGKPLGTFGHLGCFSFHQTKNYTSGEGGALSIQLEDPKLLERAEIVRQKGTNRDKFLRGEISQYTWVDIGSSYAPSDILMALLFSQLEEMKTIIEKRKSIVQRYTDCLQTYVYQGKIASISHVPSDFQSNYHNFYLLFKDRLARDYAIEKLRENSIQATIHFVPLHSSPMGRSLGYKDTDLLVSKRIGDSLMRLPLYTAMADEEVDFVIKNLCIVLEEIY